MAVRHLAEEELAQLANELNEALPPLDADEQRIALSVYRLLAEGEPVAESRVGETAGAAADRVTRALDAWPGVYRDEQGDIVGFWGLTTQELPPHRFEVEGRQLWGWCSWDTLFLPPLLGRTARIESVCGTTGEPVRAVVGPDGVHEVAPAGAVISFLRPDGPFGHDVIRSFCHHVLFFASEGAGGQWIGDRDDAFLLSLEQGFELGRRRWEAKLDAAPAPHPSTPPPDAPKIDVLVDHGAGEPG